MITFGTFWTERLVFRAVDEATDPALIQVMYADPEVLFSASSDPAPMSKVKAQRRAESAAKCLLGVMICLPASTSEPTVPGITIGRLTLFGPQPAEQEHRRSFFAITIAKPYQGKGYGSEALRWMLQFAFVHAGLHKVEGEVYSWNTPARKLYKNNGFVEGVLRKHMWQAGGWHDLIKLGMLAEEWGPAQSEGSAEGQFVS